MSNTENKLRIGITQGDINGIGLEVVIKTLADPRILEICTPVLFSSQKTVSLYRKLLGVEELHFNTVRDFEGINPKKLSVFNCYDEDVTLELGKVTPSGGKYALRSIEVATEALEKKKIDALVTSPINKHTIQSDRFAFPGHTEYFESKFGRESGALMLMVDELLKIGVVTGHIPVDKIAASISEEKIIKKALLLNACLIEDFGIRKPRIAILGLNPHAGDNGTIGQEEKNSISPATSRLKEQQVLAYGPYPADGFFASAAYKNFDAVLAMYHDQGLIPFKTLSFHSGVNYTAGLSIIRTSPDHGTAYDLAGKNKASEESFRNALYLACDIFRKRNLHAEITANPLKANPLKREKT